MKAGSQHGEDAFLMEQWGDRGPGVVFDVGARLRGSNVAKLIKERGFSGVLVEMNEGSAKQLEDYFKDDDVEVHQVKCTMDNINELAPPNIDILSIDVDSIDWWLWARLEQRPKYVVIESNLQMKTGYADYNPDVNWRQNRDNYGASQEALIKLGEIRGYRHLTTKKVNLIFERIDG